MQAHYRLEHIATSSRKNCQACHWKEWAAEQREQPWHEFERSMIELLHNYTPAQILDAMPTPEVREFLESGWWPTERIIADLNENGFDLIATIVEVNDGNDPVVIQCRDCQRISVKRMGDVGWGCTCSRNTRASNPSLPRAERVLLAESQSPALRWWDHELNDEATFRTVTVRATRACRWVCPDCGLRFETMVNHMADRPSCPDCATKRHAEWQDEYERWKITPIADVPELATAWADEDDPRKVMVTGGVGLRRFRCPSGHHPRIDPLRFLQSGCPHCRSARTAQEKKWLADTLPEIAAQWHPSRNGKRTPENVVWDSKRTVWWRADCCGHEWQESVKDRDKYHRLRCPVCRTILESLAWQDPGLAAEWSPANPVSPWYVRPHGKTAFVPEWVCATNPAHVWRMPLSSRSNGAECPECREAGKSRVELDHHAAAVEAFGNSRSGMTVRDDAFTTRSSWTTDISVDLDGRTLVIEYDGAYWHAAEAKRLVDERKSQDLLAAGHLLVRLREDDLPPLFIDHPRYREIRVYSTAPRPHAVMNHIRDWIEQLESDGPAPSASQQV